MRQNYNFTVDDTCTSSSVTVWRYKNYRFFPWTRLLVKEINEYSCRHLTSAEQVKGLYTEPVH